MSDLDLSKLSPVEKWELDERGWCPAADDFEQQAFAVLARAAFDVQLRRRWTAYLTADGWAACECDGMPLGHLSSPILRGMSERGIPRPGDDELRRLLFHADPLTALVHADEWVKANVEAKGDVQS